MGTAVVKIKVMPESPETDMKEIQNKIENLFKEKNVQNPQFEIQPIAFGLKALIIMFGWPEEDDSLEDLEKTLNSMEEIGSAEIIDMRRAIG